MSEWQETTIGELLTLQRGHDLVQTEFVDGEYLVAGSNGPIGYHNKCTAKGPGLTIGRSGNSIGVAHFYEKDFWAHNTVLYSKAFHNTHPKFVYFLLKSFDFKSFDGGSAVPTLNRNHVHPTPIKVPVDINEQKGIADILSCLDDKIDLLHRQNKTLEQLAETIFRQWFIEEAEEQSERQLVLGNLIESVSITHPFPSDEIVFLNTSDIYLGDVLIHEPVDVKYLPGQAKKSIQKHDILFSEIRPANGRYAYINFNAENYVVSTKLMVLRSKNVLSQAFIYFYLTNSQTVNWLQVLAESRSGTFPQITFEQLRDLKINIPSDSILKDSIKWCETAIEKIKSNTNQITTLIQLRDNLLPKLMSGEVRVN